MAALSKSSDQTAQDVSESLLRERLGLCQWFHYEAYDDVLAAIDVLRDLDVKYFRTNISWADFVRPGGKAWYDWQMQTLYQAGVHTLVSVWHVPPSYSVGGTKRRRYEGNENESQQK